MVYSVTGKINTLSFSYLLCPMVGKGRVLKESKGSLKESHTIPQFCVLRTDTLDSRLHRDCQSHNSHTLSLTTNLLLHVCLEVRFLAYAVFS